MFKIMSQEIIQEKKDMLEAHWNTILAVPISHQIISICWLLKHLLNHMSYEK